MDFNILKVAFGKLVESLKLDRQATRKTASAKPEDRHSESFSVTTSGIKIRGDIFFPVSHPSRLYPIAVVCHGIPGSGAPRPENDPGYETLCKDLTSLGIAALFFNFRGCGNSEGNFDMLGWVNDLETVLAHVKNTPYLDPTRIFLLGFSGGGAAAVKASADNSDIFGLIIVGTPSNFEIFKSDPKEIIEDFKSRGIIRDTGFPKDIEKWTLGFKEVEPRRWIAYFKGNGILIIHGDQDELIPLEHARELLDHAPAGISQLEIIPGGGHRLRLNANCIHHIKSWLVKELGW